MLMIFFKKWLLFFKLYRINFFKIYGVIFFFNVFMEVLIVVYNLYVRDIIEMISLIYI